IFHLSSQYLILPCDILLRYVDCLHWIGALGSVFIVPDHLVLLVATEAETERAHDAVFALGAGRTSSRIDLAHSLVFNAPATREHVHC
ncbi:hypothetical protein PENTCL1PPCAC_3889, partial [Pristionchus entomophagus]